MSTEREHAPPPSRITTLCPSCHGTGWIERSLFAEMFGCGSGHACTRCNGTGQTWTDVQIPPRIDPQ